MYVCVEPIEKAKGNGIFFFIFQHSPAAVCVCVDAYDLGIHNKLLVFLSVFYNSATLQVHSRRTQTYMCFIFGVNSFDSQ